MSISEPTLAQLIERYEEAKQAAIDFNKNVKGPATLIWYNSFSWQQQHPTESTIARRIAYDDVIMRSNQIDQHETSCCDALALKQVRLLRSYDAPWVSPVVDENGYHIPTSVVTAYSTYINDPTSNLYAYRHDPRLAIDMPVSHVTVMRSIFKLLCIGENWCPDHLYLTMARVNYAWNAMNDSFKKAAAETVSYSICSEERLARLNKSIHMYDDVDNYHISGGSRYLADLDGVGKSIANLIAQYLSPGSREDDVIDGEMSD